MQKLDVNPLCPPGSQFAFTTFIHLFTEARSRDDVVSIVTRQRGEKTEDRILVGSKAQTGSGAHPVYQLMGTGGSFPKSPGYEVEHSLPGKEVKNEWNYNPNPPICFYSV